MKRHLSDQSRYSDYKHMIPNFQQVLDLFAADVEYQTVLLSKDTGNLSRFIRVLISASSFGPLNFKTRAIAIAEDLSQLAAADKLTRARLSLRKWRLNRLYRCYDNCYLPDIRSITHTLPPSVELEVFTCEHTLSLAQEQLCNDVLDNFV